MPPESLKVMNWNACSVANRIDELTEFLTTNDIDVAVITETHLNVSLNFAIPGFQEPVRQDRKDQKWGGVAILVREGIHFREIATGTTVIESAGIELMVSNEKLNIYAVYCRSQCHKQNAQKFKSDLLKLTEPQNKFLTCGDLNARHKQWLDDANRPNGNLVLETLRSSESRSDQLTVYMPNHPTFKRGTYASYVDICLANFAMDEPIVTQKLSSDHYPVVYHVGANTCGADDQKKEIPLVEQTSRNSVPHLRSLLQTEDLSLKVLLQAVETVVPSFIDAIAVEVHNILQKKTLTKNGYQMTLSKMKCKRNDPEQSEATFANLLTTMTQPQNQKLIISSFLNVLQPLSGNHSGQLHREKDSDTVHGNLIDTLKTSLSKYRALLPTEAIFTLRQTLHKCHTYKVPTHHLFINLKNSYATINQEQLWKMVHQSYRWPADVIESLKTTSDFMNPNSHIGLQHGNPLSELLMAIALDVVIRGARIDSSGTIYEDNLQFICYADDIDLIARDFSHLERAYTKLKREAINVGLVLAFKDSKYMYAQPKSKTMQMTKVTLDHDEFDVEKKCEFLDSTITYDNDLAKEIDRRITIGNTFQELLDSTFKTLDKEAIYKTQIRPQVLYGHESWVLTKSSVSLKKLKDFECEVLRSIYGKLRACDGKSYEAKYSDMLQRIAELDIEHSIKIRRLRWAGHVLRMPEDCPARIALESKPNVKLPRGKPPAQWIDCVEQDLRNVKRYTNWRNAAQDTELWNQLLDTAKSKWTKRKVRKCRFRIKQDSESSQ